MQKLQYLFYRKDTEINSLNSKLEDEQSLVAQLQKKIKELQVMFSLCSYSTLRTTLRLVLKIEHLLLIREIFHFRSE